MNLRYQDFTSRPLTDNEREIVIKSLLTQQNVSFDSLKKKKLKLDSSIIFSHEHMKTLKGDETAGKLRGTKLYGKDWDKLSISDQSAIVKKTFNR